MRPKGVRIKPEIVVVDPYLRKTLIMLIDELNKINSATENQEELIVEMFMKFGLLEIDSNGKIRLTEKGRKLVRMEDSALEHIGIEHTD